VTAKSGHNAADFRKLQKWFELALFEAFSDGQLLYYKNRHIVTVTNVSGFFVNICDLVYFLYFTSVLNRLTYIGCCRTNNFQEHFCF
jgi:hypothetical protein